MKVTEVQVGAVLKCADFQALGPNVQALIEVCTARALYINTISYHESPMVELAAHEVKATTRRLRALFGDYKP